MSRPWIAEWHPDDDVFWESTGKRIARRNLVFSIFAEFLGFTVWLLWSVTAVRLSKAGFNFSTSQLFTLVSVPALVGAAVRIPYTFAVARFGGRNWTVVSASLLLIPIAFLVVLVSDPDTPFWLFLVGAGTAGLGGGNFASSMANISYFYPDKRKGVALGFNAAGGNVGVAVVQLIVPLVVGVGALAVVGGSQGAAPDGSGAIYLQNAALIWVPFILTAVACAWFFMDNLRVAVAPPRAQAVVLRRSQTWVMSWLYVGTFGSFIGYSAGLPLMVKTQFPQVGLSIAFLGPLIGSISRPAGGWLADRLGGARITFATFVAMSAAAGGVGFFLSNKNESWAFNGFLSSFVVLFLLAGIGNGSTFRMIPVIFRALHLAEVTGQGPDAEKAAVAKAKRETAAVLGFTSAIGAFGGWLIPQGYGLSTAITGQPQSALIGFVAFYASCLGLTWWFYLRRRESPGRVPSFASAGV